MVLRSEGRTFCAGASFTELQQVATPKDGKEFFLGFARVLLAIKEAPQFVLVRVQGKSVGGGVGIIAAADYAIATQEADIRLSELDLGIGPFVVGPFIERKIGSAAFQALTIDRKWLSAEWAHARGLYAELTNSAAALDTAVSTLAEELAALSPEAAAELKSTFWEGTADWQPLLDARAEKSGALVTSPIAQAAIKAAAGKKA